MSYRNEYAPWADIAYQLTDEEKKAAAEAVRGGGGGTTTSSATATAEPGPVRNQREKYILSSSDSQLATMLKQGVVTRDELERLLPESRMAKVLDNQVTATEMAQKFTIPKQDIDSFESPQNVLAGRSTVDGSPMGQGEPVSGAGGPASSAVTASTRATTSSRTSSSGGGGTGGSGSPAAAAPTIAGDFVANNGRPYIAYQGQKYMLPPGVMEDDPRVIALLQRLGAGDTAGSVVGGTKADLYLRGGTDLGKAVVSNGQQYRASGIEPVQQADGKWYIPGQQTPFSSESSARAAMPLVNTGAAVTSRLGNSPTAKAAGQGGFTNRINPDRSLFPLISMDQSIAAGATKGNQVGDILGTSVREGYQPLDITLGGISEGGGLTPVGNPEDPYSSFTGQLPGDVSIGQSSILGNSGYNTLYWLQQSTGIPESTLAAMKLTAPQALQLEQAAATLRQQGLMPDLASLKARNEPSGYEGAAGGSQLKWGSANGGSSNTPYDQALGAFLDYADVKTPDLTYLPDPSGYGSTQVGNVVTAHQYDEALGYKDGGQFKLNEPSTLVGDYSGQPYARIAEAGKQEKVTIEPTREDITMKRERGMMPLRGGQPVGFATGGEIYGGSKGWVQTNSNALRDDAGTVTDYGQQLGFKSDPYAGGGGASGIQSGNAVNIVRNPMVSRSGMPVAASFEQMSPSQTLPFTNQGGAMPNQMISGPLSAQPIGTQTYGNTVLPVYDQLNPKTYGPEMDQYKGGYRYVPMNVGGTPALVRVQEYNAPMIPQAQQNAQKIAYLTQLLSSNGDPGDLVGNNPGSRAATLAALYDLDPKAAMLYASQGGGQGQAPWGQDGMGRGGMPGFGYGRRDQQIEDEARRRRQYDIDAYNWSRSGLPSPTLLNLDVNSQAGGAGGGAMGSGGMGSGGGDGSGFGGNPDRQGPDYYPYSRQVRNGFALPFDYEPNSNPWANRGGGQMPWRGYQPDWMNGGNTPPWGGRRPGWGGRRARMMPVGQPMIGAAA